MPIWFVIYSIDNYASFGIKHVHYCIPTTVEDADKIYQQYRDIMYCNARGFLMQCEYVHRSDTSYLKNETEEKKEVDYSSSKEWE